MELDRAASWHLMCNLNLRHFKFEGIFEGPIREWHVSIRHQEVYLVGLGAFIDKHGLKW